jgi:hypothetical protein
MNYTTIIIICIFIAIYFLHTNNYDFFSGNIIFSTESNFLEQFKNIIDNFVDSKIDPTEFFELAEDNAKTKIQTQTKNTPITTYTIRKNSDESLISGNLKKKPVNKLYYGLDCEWVKDDTFYTALKEEGFNVTKNIKEASLIVPCSYETTEKEIKDLKEAGIKDNIYGKKVRIFMLNNTDYIVSKLSIWEFLEEKYGKKIASTMIPQTWNLNNDKQIDDFKKNFSKNKIYITKNNNQRQEGLEIHTTLDSIIKAKDKYLLVQELLQNPYLIRGRKINLRVYCLIIKDANENMKVQVYQDGFMYYTPEFFEKGNPSFKKNITTGYIDRQVYVENPLTHGDFKKYLDNKERTKYPIEEYLIKTKPNTKLSTYVFSQINLLMRYIFDTYQPTIGTDTPGVGFQLYGVDVAIDDKLKPMIMEVNKGPDLTAKDGRDKDLKVNLSKDMLKSVGLIKPNVNNKFLTVSEVVKLNNELIYIDNSSQLSLE